MKNEIKNGNEKLALGLIYIIMKLQRAKPQHENIQTKITKVCSWIKTEVYFSCRNLFAKQFGIHYEVRGAFEAIPFFVSPLWFSRWYERSHESFWFLFEAHRTTQTLFRNYSKIAQFMHMMMHCVNYRISSGKISVKRWWGGDPFNSQRCLWLQAFIFLLLCLRYYSLEKSWLFGLKEKEEENIPIRVSFQK